MTTTSTTIPTTRIKESRVSTVNWETLGFGSQVSDHMLIAQYKNGEWLDVQILPFQDITISPTALGLHYGQSVFEGIKALKRADGKLSVFRLERHFHRFNRSLERMCMPPVPEFIFMEGIRQLVGLDADWVPNRPGYSLYIRPFMFASEARYGVKVSDEYTFIVFTGPVPPYYAHPLKVKVETYFRRAVHGGAGFAKNAGNYGASLYPAKLAKEQGYDQVLWTDGSDDLFIEESGTMNIMFLIDDVLITPPVGDTSLDGVTRDSLLQLAENMGYKTQIRKISAYELAEANRAGKLQEAFGVGTAAVTAPIELIGLPEEEIHLPDQADPLSLRLREELEAIRTGRKPDLNGWNDVV